MPDFILGAVSGAGFVLAALFLIVRRGAAIEQSQCRAMEREHAEFLSQLAERVMHAPPVRIIYFEPSGDEKWRVN